jgi:hypothetical protein
MARLICFHRRSNRQKVDIKNPAKSEVGSPSGLNRLTIKKNKSTPM